MVTKSDIDRIKQRAGGRKLTISKIRAILVMYRFQGKAASSCMDEIEKAMRGVK